MNQAFIDGYIGAIDEKDSHVALRICHKERYINEKTDEWEFDESWISIEFFGRKADAIRRVATINDHIFIRASMITWPKEGPESRIRFHGIEFHVADATTRRGPGE